MPGLEDLYREIILDHYRTPRNRGELPVPPARHAEGHNPLCGDEITVYLDVEGDGPDAVVNDVKVSGQGCSISQSSASMMSAAIKGKTVGEARALVHRFEEMVGIEPKPGAELPDADVDLGDLEALQGVAKFPVRIKCATLAWYTLVEALDRPASDS
jgi:nitrogen fixation NifU-like protein